MKVLRVDDVITAFPDPSLDYEQGVVAVGGELSTALLKQAYAQGIFPWPHEDCPMLWFCPDERGVIDFAEFHVPSSLIKWGRKYNPQIRINQNFAEVIAQCQAQARPGQAGTWITEEIKLAYTELSKKGFAKSVEVFIEDKLVGGIYGVQSKNYFSAESMFFLTPNASKWALYNLKLHLESNGATWMDIQMVTDVSKSFGGKTIPKKDFLKRIK